MGRRQKRGLSKAHDERPYINDSGRLFSGPADAVAVTGGMTILALAFGFDLFMLSFAQLRHPPSPGA